MYILKTMWSSTRDTVQSRCECPTFLTGTRYALHPRESSDTDLKCSNSPLSIWVQIWWNNSTTFWLTNSCSTKAIGREFKQHPCNLSGNVLIHPVNWRHIMTETAVIHGCVAANKEPGIAFARNNMKTEAEAWRHMIQTGSENRGRLLRPWFRGKVSVLYREW